MISFMIPLLYIHILMIFDILLTHGHRLVRHGDRVVAPGTAGDATPRHMEISPGQKLGFDQQKLGLNH